MFPGLKATLLKHFLYFALFMPFYLNKCYNYFPLKGKATISNDGATIVKLLDVVHPAAKMLVDIAKSQDAEVGRVSIL